MSTKEAKAKEELRFDVRLVERLARVGKFESKEYDEYLKRLPDDEARGEYIEVFEEPKPETVPSDAEALTFT